MKSRPASVSLLLAFSILFGRAAPNVWEVKLDGIVRLENRRVALLELTTENKFRQVITRIQILAEGEGDPEAACDVLAIDEQQAKVILRLADKQVERKLEQK